MRVFGCFVAAITGLTGWYAGAETAPSNVGDKLSQPIRIERLSPVTMAPLRLHSGKIYLQAAINGAGSEFIFDTGSPTILDTKIAEQLDLSFIGKSTGKDANGTPVSMDIAIADVISIGGTVFHDVPVLVHDFSGVPMGDCYIPNGVLGSELLPGRVWRLDTENASLAIARSLDDLPAIKSNQSAPLHLFGYPHAPIVDYSIGTFSDKALFDTGNTAELALFSPIAKDKAVRPQIEAHTRRQGRGRLGTSAGGTGELVPLTRFQLKAVQIGAHTLEHAQTQLRPVPPTLIGAGLLNSHIVTLDYPNARFIMSPLKNPRATKPNQDFALHVAGGRVEVMQIYENSKAQGAGLRLGDKIAAINGTPLSISSEAERCDTSLWLSNNFDASSVKTLSVKRGEALIEIVF